MIVYKHYDVEDSIVYIGVDEVTKELEDTKEEFDKYKKSRIYRTIEKPYYFRSSNSEIIETPFDQISKNLIDIDKFNESTFWGRLKYCFTGFKKYDEQPESQTDNSL